MKKLLLSFGAAATVVTPIVAVVSCGTTGESTKQTHSSKETTTSYPWDKYPDVMVLWGKELKMALNGFKIAGQEIAGIDKMFTNSNDPHVYLSRYNEVAKIARKLTDPTFQPAIDAAPANDTISQEAINDYKNHVVFVLKNVVVRRYPVADALMGKLNSSASDTVVKLHEAALNIAKVSFNKDGGSAEAQFTGLINAIPYNPQATGKADVDSYASSMRNIFQTHSNEIFSEVKKLDVSTVEAATTLQDIIAAADALCQDYSADKHSGDNLVAHKPNFGPVPTFNSLNAQTFATYKETLKKQLGLTVSTEIDSAKTAQEAYGAAWLIAIQTKSVAPETKTIDNFNKILARFGLSAII